MRLRKEGATPRPPVRNQMSQRLRAACSAQEALQQRGRVAQFKTRKPAGGPSAAEVWLRIATALPGGYAMAWLTAQAGSLLLFRAGLTTRADAVLIATNLGLLLAPGVVVYAFATRRPFRLATAAGGAALASAVAARLL